MTATNDSGSITPIQFVYNPTTTVPSVSYTTTTGGSAALYLFPNPALNVKLLDDRAKLPQKAHHGDLGYDLFALDNTYLAAKGITKVNTGIACGFPPGYGALLRDRSSIATKEGVFIVAGVIDNGYTGEIIVAFQNPTGLPILFTRGKKIAQMILTPVITFPVVSINDLGTTARGTGGFGSTDNK